MKVLLTSCIKVGAPNSIGLIESQIARGCIDNRIKVSHYYPWYKTMFLTDFLEGAKLPENYDIIHGHTDITWNTPNAIRTFHGVTAKGYAEYSRDRDSAKGNWLYQEAYLRTHAAIEKKCALNNHCIAVSQFVKDNLIKYYGVAEDNVDVIHNGCDTTNFKPNKTLGEGFRFAFDIPEDEFVVSWVGHGEFNKGLKYLYSVAKYLTDVTFIIRGNITFSPYYERVRELKNVKIIPKQGNLNGFYNAADVQLLTSVYEPFCLTLLEGMACGKTFVAFDSGGHTEIENGIISPNRDTWAMINRIKRLKEDENYLKDYGKAARREVLKRFTVKKMVDENIAVYKKYAG